MSNFLSRGAGLVLVVEDDPLIRDFEAGILRRAGYEVLVAEDGIEGGSVFARYFQEIDVLVTDISMPGMDGLKLANFARNIRADLHIVFASGSIDANSNEFTGRFSESILLAKPFTAEELCQSVARCLVSKECSPAVLSPHEGVQ